MTATALARMHDASDPPAGLADSVAAVAGYLGGDTPHVWTAAQWAKCGNVRRLGIWVAKAGGADGRTDALGCLDKIQELRIPRGSAVAYDLETAFAGPQVTVFHRILSFFGYKVWVYGSVSTVFANPECDGYWVADYTGKPELYDHAGVVATQYKAGTGMDYSVVDRHDMRADLIWH